MPVGIAMMVYPNSITIDERNFPVGVTGVTSPKPTVVIVTMA